jgi:hypothetical protein
VKMNDDNLGGVIQTSNWGVRVASREQAQPECLITGHCSRGVRHDRNAVASRMANVSCPATL